MTVAQDEKINVKSIVMDGEGAVGHKTVTSWAAAEMVLNRYRYDAPKSGYWKVDFKVEFEDGETYHGRYDLAHPMSQRRVDEPGLKLHVQKRLLFHGGYYCPAHFEPETYLDWLRTVDKHQPGAMEGCRILLERYDVVSNYFKMPARIVDPAQVTTS